MRYLLIFVCFLASHLPDKTLRYMDSNTVKLDGKQRFVDVMRSVNLRKQPQHYLQTPEIRLNKLTKIDAVEKTYDYEDATGGTDVDLYTTIFIKASDKKNGGRWMLIFDAKTECLIQVVYSKTSGGLVFYKS